ncbi:MAG: AI-2E family transporter, partial [Eggerthellaceae bacterium]
PVVGPWIGGVIAALVGLFVDPWAAFFALVLTIVVQQFVYTFISPKIMSNSVDVHPAIVIVVLLVGSAIGGSMAGLVGSVVGMLFSIPLAAILKTVFVFYFERETGRQVVSEDGVFFKGMPSDLCDEDGAPDAVADAWLHPQAQVVCAVFLGEGKACAETDRLRTPWDRMTDSREESGRNSD